MWFGSRAVKDLQYVCVLLCENHPVLLANECMPLFPYSHIPLVGVGSYIICLFFSFTYIVLVHFFKTIF